MPLLIILTSYWNSCRNSNCIFYPCIFFNYGSSQEIIENNKKEEKEHDKIATLAKSKLNSIETPMCEALIDLNITHEEFQTIVNEKEKHEQMKESIRNTKSRDELSENSRDIRKNSGNKQI